MSTHQNDAGTIRAKPLGLARSKQLISNESFAMDGQDNTFKAKEGKIDAPLTPSSAF